MWRWRDWVIDAFNANLPYDRFIIEQLAGDLLPGATLEQRIATGFDRNHVINTEGGIIDEEYRVEYVADRVRHHEHGLARAHRWSARAATTTIRPDHASATTTASSPSSTASPEHGEDGRRGNAVPMIPAPTARAAGAS